MDGNGMQFKHTYMTKDKMKKAGEGAFSSQFKSYIADGESALKDKIHGGVSREDVMKDVRRSLRQEMKRANDRSNAAAIRMQAEHRQLRDQMQDALMTAKEATRQRKLLDAQMLAEKSKQSNSEAENSETELNEMLERQQQELTDNPDGLMGEAYNRKFEDMQMLSRLKEQATQNKTVRHHKNLFSLFRAWGKAVARTDLEEEMMAQDQIIEEKTQILRTKTLEWNEKRKRYADESFRKFYNDFDGAAGRYRMLNRRGTDVMAPVKDVKEYVGIFDIVKLEDTLARLQDNPYLEAQVQIRNKKDNRSNAEEDLIKAHTRMTMLGEANEVGMAVRYKLNSDFSGYEAKRQFDRKNELTVINEYNDAYQKQVYDAERLQLAVDEKDATGQKFINSEDNVEIIQAKQKKWFGAKTVNGVFLNGEFVSADRKVIENSKDAKATGTITSWEKLAEKEKVRRAVLKASIFRQINSKTIQHAMGYGAGAAAGATKVKNSMITSLSKAILSEEGLTEWTDKAEVEDDVIAAVGEFFEQVEEGEVNKKRAKENDREKADRLLKAQKKVVSDRIFSDKYEKDLFDKAKAVKESRDPANGGPVEPELPDTVMAKWERILTGDDEEAKAKIPTAVKTKVAYDVLRQEYAIDQGAMNSLEDTASRTGKVIAAVRDDHKALADLSLLLLSEDTNPDYWMMARTICSRMIMTGFEKKWKDTFDSRYNRALAKGRAESGQMMRIALIDELNANRSHWDPENVLNALMPTRWKQFSEDVQGMRGIGAIFAQKFTDGSLLSFANDMFTSFVDGVDAFEYYGKGTIANLQLANLYSATLTSAMNMGAITEAGAYAISDIIELKKEDGDREEADSRRYSTSLAFAMLNNLLKIIKTCKKFMKDKRKDAEKKAKKDPAYDPKAELEYTENAYYKMIISASYTAIGIGTAITKYLGPGAKRVKAGFGMVKSILGTYEDAIAIRMANKKIGRIKETEGQLTALEDKEYKNAEDEKMLEVLKGNSQLQYGLACAKRKNRDERALKVVSVISNAGKSVINGIKTFWPTGSKSLIVKGIDAVWGTLMTGAKMVTEMVRHKLGVKANVEKMLGKEFRSTSTDVLNDVLRREVGITSSDYLTDLARIFMSIDTHVFMQEAETDSEKIVGTKIIQTLFNNKEYNENNLKKAKVDKIMGELGVKGNFRTILKHSLAGNPA